MLHKSYHFFNLTHYKKYYNSSSYCPMEYILSFIIIITFYCFVLLVRLKIFSCAYRQFFSSFLSSQILNVEFVSLFLFCIDMKEFFIFIPFSGCIFIRYSLKSLGWCCKPESFSPWETFQIQ